MAQVNHGGGHRIEQPVKVEDGFHVGARQHQHDDPQVSRRELDWRLSCACRGWTAGNRLVPNGPPRRDVGPQRPRRRKTRLKSETAREWRR